MKTLENYLGRMVNMKLCKECRTENPDYANMCCVCGSKNLVRFDEVIDTYMELDANKSKKSAKFNDLCEYIDDPLVLDDKRYTSARLKDLTRRVFDGYKIVENIKYDNEATFSLVNYWTTHPDTKAYKIDKLDDIVRMYFDRDKSLRTI